jgi:hypothetical protein
VRAWGGMLIQSLDSAPQWAPASRTAAALRSPADRILSDERTVTRWACAAGHGPIFAGPKTGSGHFSRLRRYTEDGFPEIYVLLRLHFDADGREWVKLRIPVPPNGGVGWVPRESLYCFRATRDLVVVDRCRLSMRFFTDGRLRWSAPVAVGRRTAPTPAGRFWIRERFRVFDSGSCYWPYAFGTTGYSPLSDWPQRGVVGIHGPGPEPDAIPGRLSQGCIAVGVADNAWLAEHLGLGTPLLVL